MTAEQWREDVDFFATQLVKKHKNVFHTLGREEFERDIAQLKADIPSLKDYQVYVRMLQITCKVGDGHTYIPHPSNFRFYPFITYWFGEDLYVTQAASPYKEAVGKKLVKIEDMPMQQVNEKLMKVLSNDENHWYIMQNHPANLIRPEILHTLGIVEKLSHAKQEPLYRQNPSSDFWFTYVEDMNAVYVNFRKYDELSRNVNKLFDFIEEKKATRLIIDLPGPGRRFHKGAQATYSSYSANDEMTLPNSKLIVSYSTRYYKFLDEDVPAFEPDVRVDPDWKTYKEGIDPVMEKIRQIVKK